MKSKVRTRNTTLHLWREILRNPDFFSSRMSSHVPKSYSDVPLIFKKFNKVSGRNDIF